MQSGCSTPSILSPAEAGMQGLPWRLAKGEPVNRRGRVGLPRARAICRRHDCVAA